MGLTRSIRSTVLCPPPLRLALCNCQKEYLLFTCLFVCFFMFFGVYSCFISVAYHQTIADNKHWQVGQVNKPQSVCSRSCKGAACWKEYKQKLWFTRGHCARFCCCLQAVELDAACVHKWVNSFSSELKSESKTCVLHRSFNTYRDIVSVLSARWDFSFRNWNICKIKENKQKQPSQFTEVK